MSEAGSGEDESEELLAMSGLFRHPFRDRMSADFGQSFGPYDDRALPANERNMCALSATLRAKPDWWVKIQDKDIRARWKAEATGAPVPYGNIPLKEDEVEYVLDELVWYASRRVEENGIEASIFQRIWQSDALVSDSLRSGLLQVARRLEDVPADKQDWHPRADGQVLDLVHPSLYCIVYSTTVAIDRDDEIEPRPPGVDVELVDPYAADSMFMSDKFSWLPTDFAISEDGGTAKALAYINNLHPAMHAEAYPVIEALVACFVPLWERVLAESRAGFEMRRLAEDHYYWQELTEPSHSGESDGEDDEAPIPRILHLPSAKIPFEPHAEPKPVNLKGRTLQVIVKLADIVLTPEKPQYPGGSWHVEGMVNEGIVASGIYYYDEENITESALAFRMGVSEPGYENGDDEGMDLVYKLAREGPLVQYIGSVATKQGRCIAFPNVYQHQVQPFELVDKSRSGHRKIVALFLVDPALPYPRPSTSDIPPQQKDWIKMALQEAATDLRGSHPAAAKGLGKLPVEVIDMIVDQADWLMSRKDAEAVRLELMDERSVMTDSNNENMFETMFCMCEH